MRSFKNTPAFIEGKVVYVGLDVHKKRWAFCSYCDGEVIEKIQIGGCYNVLKCLLQQHYSMAREIRLVYEAGFSGFWLYRKLKADGYQCIVTPPNLTPKSGTLVKTDRRDAEKLAMYLAANLLKTVYVPPPEVEADRRLIRRRAQLIKKQTRGKNEIKSFLNLRGIEKPKDIKVSWTQRYLAWLLSLNFEYESDTFVFTQLIKSYQLIRGDLAELTESIRRLSRHDKYRFNFALLTQGRGVGLITAMTFLLEIYDFGRFQNERQFCSYLGLTPAQFSTGEHVRLGHITRQGNAQLRWLLIESAWTVIRYDPHLREKYQRLRTRGTNGKKAIVAVARSLAVRLRRCLLDGTGYVIGVC